MFKNTFSRISSSVNPEKSVLSWVVLLFPYVAMIGLYFWFNTEMMAMRNAFFIVVNKGDYSLKVIDYKGNVLKKFDVTLGKNAGDKAIRGDMKTPEGIFPIVDVKNSSEWTFDFEDDTLGPVKGVYGPWFLRLEVPKQSGIGLHGTNDPSVMKTRASHGCIRLRNADIIELKEMVKLGTIVIVIPGKDDILQNVLSVEKKNDETVLDKSLIKKIGKTVKMTKKKRR